MRMHFILYSLFLLVLNLCWQLAKILFLRDKNLSFFLSILQKLFEVNLYNYLVESDSFLNSFCTISPGTNKAACVWMMHHSSSKRCYFLDPSFDEKCFFVVFYIMNKTQVEKKSTIQIIECNIFKWDGKVMMMWHQHYHRIWKYIVIFFK